MKILVIGSGGREHAITWKLTRSPEDHEIIVTPGNAGISKIAECVNISVNNTEELVNLAVTRKVDLVVIGPEAPLANGLADALVEQSISVFGPSQAAAQLESSKIYSKQFCARHSIPTAAFEICQNAREVHEAATRRAQKCVIKADGLAAGKGVFVCHSIEDVDHAVEEMFVNQTFGDASARVIVEDCLTGEEASILILVDGTDYVILESSQDHKAVGEGDTGPNTGGMGAYSPAPVITPDLRDVIDKRVVKPTVNGLKSEDTPFTGVLYAGLMICNGTPWVLEYNVRFGDPETQPVLMRLETDLAPLLLACATGRLNQFEPLRWSTKVAVCVVIASGGYPGKYEKGYRIAGLNEVSGMTDVVVFHAGTSLDNQNHVVTAGGRVLGVTALGDSIEDACNTAYAVVDKVKFEKHFYRRDIAYKALHR